MHQKVMTKNICSCEERIVLDAIIKYTVVTFLSVSKRRNNGDEK